MVTFSENSILSVKHGVVMVHCNTEKTMGDGLAAKVRSLYPQVFPAYKEACWAYENDRIKMLGSFCSVQVKKDLWICLAFAQFNMAKYDTNTRPEAYAKIFRKIRKQMELQRAIGDGKTIELHVPSNLGIEGKSDFENDILPIINREFGDSKVPCIIDMP